MDEFFGFLGLLILLVVVGLPVYFLIAIHGLKTRVASLETLVLEREDVGEIKPLSEPVLSPAADQQDEIPEEFLEKPAVSEKPTPAWHPTPKVKRKRESFVFNTGKIAQMVTWAKENWVFILAGVSLALAGVFLVQYGVEKGLLTPQMRVMGAIVFGLALIGLGEVVRRKSAGDETGSFALLPSVFAGAGLVAVFAGVLSARMLYGLIDPGFAFAGLAITGAVAVLLGWIYGPFLAALGVFGALAAPFLVGGNPDGAGPLHLYFALIAVVALAIDAYKRWAWLSALALIGSFAASWLLLQDTDTGFYAVLFAFVTALLATALPELSLTPRHQGQRVSSFLTQKPGTTKHEFPTRVAAGTFIAATVFIGWIYSHDASLFWLVLMVLGLMLLAALFWMKDAPALADLAFVPPIIALLVIAGEAVNAGAVAVDWVADAAVSRDPLVKAPLAGLYLMVGAMAASLGFAWRSYFSKHLKVTNAVFAAGFAPWVAIVLEVYWWPSHVLSTGIWALYLAGVAMAMVALTERFARVDSDDRTRTALFALSSMSMLSFMMVVLLGDVALTLSLAVMVMAAAWLGTRFRLWLLDWYIQAGVVAVSFRLVAYPGLEWGFDAPLWEVLIGFLGVVALLTVALWVKRAGKASVVVVLESAIWTLNGILATLLLARWLDAQNSEAQVYVVLSFIGLVWLMLSGNQLYRLKAGGRLRQLRIVLASLYGLAALFFLAVAAVLNPAVDSYFKVAGWPVFGSLGAAYLLPALLFGFMAWWLSHLPRRLRIGFIVLAAAFAALFVGLEIRHFWQGGNMASSIVLKPELYSYTVAMILASAGLLALAFVRQSPVLRKLALVMVALVVLKVFFIDMSELDGLLRVGSFLALGLVAALMAWVNRMLKMNEAQQVESAEGP